MTSLSGEKDGGSDSAFGASFALTLSILNVESPSLHEIADASSPSSPAFTHSEQTSQGLLEVSTKKWEL